LVSAVSIRELLLGKADLELGTLIAKSSFTLISIILLAFEALLAIDFVSSSFFYLTLNILARLLSRESYYLGFS
jgi:hypothetical protein